MQKVKLNKRLLAAREKDGPMQFMMNGTECYMDDNRAAYHIALGEVEAVDDKPKAKKKSAAKKAAAPDEGGEDAGVDAEPDL